MIKLKSVILCLFLMTLSMRAMAESNEESVNEINVDLTEFCKDEQKEPTAMPGPCVLSKADPAKIGLFTDQLGPIVQSISGFEPPDKSKANTCRTIKAMSETLAPPIEMHLSDDQGDKWKIRFHFGFTRTNIRPADVTIHSSLINTEIKNFQFEERTSGEHYNPATWQHPQDAARWLDEPSNTFALSIENKHNAFYITAFHPKFLKTYYAVKDGNGTTNVPASVDHSLSLGTPDVFQAIPEGQTAFEIQNTHKLMNYQIGYGRKFTLMDKKVGGKITYIARADLGVIMGAARSIVVTPDGQWIENRDGLKVQGYTGSLGNRVEWKPKGEDGKLAVYVEHKYSKLSDQHYQFLDGEAKAVGGDFSTVNFGIVLDVFNPNRSNKKK